MSSAVRLYRFEPRELPCGPGCRLIIAQTREGEWDAVYYQARYAGDPIGARFAIRKRILLDALRVIAAEADEPWDADAIVAWIRATSWGAPLRGLTALRPPVSMPQDERLAIEHGEDPYA